MAAISYDPSIIYSVDSLAAHWGVLPDTIYRMIRSKRLPAFKVGREYRITDRAVREYEEGVSA